jgi:hypothetical protein
MNVLLPVPRCSQEQPGPVVERAAAHQVVHETAGEVGAPEDEFVAGAHLGAANYTQSCKRP